MLVIEIPRTNSELINQVKNTFNNCEILEVNSLGTDTVIQIFVPLITVGIPAASAIIVQILKTAKTSVKYNNIEVNGTPKNVAKILDAVKKAEESDRITSSDGDINES